MAVFSGPITGRKVAAIFASFFVVIIAVNVGLAVAAVRTFPGVEDGNSYVASQEFDRDRAAQDALGWDVSARLEGIELVLTINHDGQPARVTSVAGLFGRPTTTTSDQSPAFTFDGTAWRAPVTAGAGNWNLRVEAVAADGTPFHRRLVLRGDPA